MSSQTANMLDETATVIAVNGDYAMVECISRSACSQCQAASSCGNSSVAKAFAPRQHQFRVKLSQSVCIGQEIHVGLPAKSLIRSAVLVYMLPLVLMIIGAVGVNQFITREDGSVLLGALIGGGLGFILTRYLARKLDGRHSYQPVMLSIVDVTKEDPQ